MENYEIKKNDFKNRLKTIIGDEKPFPWANRIGLTPGVFTRMWNEGVPPKAQHLLLISIRTGVSIDWLLTGEGPMYREGGDGAGRTKDALPTTDRDVISGEYIQVPRYEVNASAGDGAVVYSEQIVDYLSFRTDWVQNALGVSVKDLALINVIGDSMEPTLSEGDVVLLDMTTKGIMDSAVYVLQLNGSLLVKRIQRKLDGSLVVKSDNKLYEPEVVSSETVEQLKIIGRVVWVGRRF